MRFPHTKSRQRRRAFTLMEILVVLAILGLLAGLAISRFTGVLDSSKEDAARLFVNTSIKVPLMSYKLHTGDFPTTSEGLKALVDAPENRGGWRGPYLEPARVPVDPWNRPYHYAFPGNRNRNGYDIWSAGADGQSGTEDDIGNWESNQQGQQR